MREESSGVMHKEDMNGRKAQKGDGQHNRRNLTHARRGKEGNIRRKPKLYWNRMVGSKVWQASDNLNYDDLTT